MTHSPFQRIALISKPEKSPELLATLSQVRDFLQQRNIEILCSERTAEALGCETALPLDALAQAADLAIVVGGDGTLLASARELIDGNLPLLGINLGRLGFLVDISPENALHMLGEVLDGHYEEDARFLLRCQIGDRKPELALNDVVVHKWNLARMIEFETWVNDRFVDRQRSDGLIISTPTGSTAYALSGGGPLLEPNLDAISLVPICPHRLSNRPIVVHGNSRISVAISERAEPNTVRVTCDGQVCLEINARERLHIEKHSTALRLLHPAGHDHYEILRAKLAWGERQH